MLFKIKKYAYKKYEHICTIDLNSSNFLELWKNWLGDEKEFILSVSEYETGKIIWEKGDPFPQPNEGEKE